MPELAVVIVSWNVRDLLRACLRSLLADLESEGLEAAVWVVDNASTDGTPERIAGEFPAVHLIASSENLGFAAGNNRALREIAAGQPAAGVRYVWLLNPDTEVLPGATRALVAALDSDLKAGVVGAKLLYSDGSLQHSAFRFPGLAQLVFEFLPLPARLYDTPLNGRYPRRLYEGSRPFPVDHPLGAAMMARWAAVEQAGFLDEGFWMYCEEIDWCWRMRRWGWRALCAPAARVVHHAGKSSEQAQADALIALWRSRLRLYEKHYSPLKRLLARRLVRIGMRWKAQSARLACRRGRIAEDELAVILGACRNIQALA